MPIIDKYDKICIQYGGEKMEEIKLKGAKNVRELCGIPIKGGKIKSGFLIRSSHLNSLTESDISILKNKYNLKCVIDLRNGIEKSEKPDVNIDGIEYLEMPIFDSTLPGISHETKQDINNIPDMRELYEYVMNSACLDNIAAVVRKIAGHENGAVLYHCTEGKDRTGMVTAVLLSILGASKNDILDDYLYTNKVNLKKAKKYRFLVKYIKMNKEASKKVYNVFIAKEDYVNEVLKKLDEIGMESFKKDVLKLTDVEIEAFRKRITEE